MKRLSRYFFRGLITILPLGLTVYLLYLFLSWSESLAMQMIRPFIGDFYVPGLGLVLGVAIVFVLGVIVSQPWLGRLLLLIELPFTNLPVVKSIYSSLKTFADYFSPDHTQSPQQVVVLRWPDSELEIIGMVTRQDLSDLPDGLLRGDRVAVYLPMGYMIGGYTVFVPRAWVHAIEMSVEEGMRQSLMAWMGSKRNVDAASSGAATGRSSTK